MKIWDIAIEIDAKIRMNIINPPEKFIFFLNSIVARIPPTNINNIDNIWIYVRASFKNSNAIMST